MNKHWGKSRQYYYSVTRTPEAAKTSQVNKQNHFHIYGNDMISNKHVQKIPGTGRSNISVSLELFNSTRRFYILSLGAP